MLRFQRPLVHEQCSIGPAGLATGRRTRQWPRCLALANKVRDGIACFLARLDMPSRGACGRRAVGLGRVERWHVLLRVLQWCERDCAQVWANMALVHSDEDVRERVVSFLLAYLKDPHGQRNCTHCPTLARPAAPTTAYRYERTPSVLPRATSSSAVGLCHRSMCKKPQVSS